MPRVQFDNWLTVETYRRATRLILALEAWKLDHGGLPQSLNELRGKYFDQVPVDPRTGDAFQYEPKGLPYCAAWGPAVAQTIKPRQPFVGCASWSGRRYEPPVTDSEFVPPVVGLADEWVFPIP